jgi:hypothetical protein
MISFDHISSPFLYALFSLRWNPGCVWYIYVCVSLSLESWVVGCVVCVCVCARIYFFLK